MTHILIVGPPPVCRDVAVGKHHGPRVGHFDLIHEAGHFLLPRSAVVWHQSEGILFSVGVGPKIAGFTRGGGARGKG